MVKLYLMAPKKDKLLKGNPYALLNLAHWTRKNSDVSVEIIDDVNKIKENEAYIGISVTTPTYQEGLKLARQIKQKSKDLKTIFGGYHTKGQGKLIIKHPEIDYVIEGEGEKSILKILKGEKNKVLLGESLNSYELDSINIEDLLKINQEYFTNLRQFGRLNYLSTRGCLHKCSFCASGEKLAKKSIEKVTDDLEFLTKKGFNQISFQDNYFGYSPKRIREICNKISKRKIHLDWDCQTRVESMQDESLLRIMADAGCTACYIGTENFHPKVLDKMNKTRKSNEYLDMTKKAIKNMLSVKIKPCLNLQVGLSYENEEIMQTNLQALKELTKKDKINVYPHLSVIYPGTPDFYKLIRQGISENVFETFTIWENNHGEEIRGLLEESRFIHGAGGIPLGVLDFEGLKKGRYKIDTLNLERIKDYVKRINFDDY